MFASKPPTCTGRTLDLSRKDSDIRYLRHLGNSDIAFYLTWKAREYGVTTRFIELAGEINASMPKYVIRRAMLALNDQGKALKGARIVLVGLAYKKNVDDDRESPTYALWDELVSHGAAVSYFDPFCPENQAVSRAWTPDGYSRSGGR